MKCGTSFVLHVDKKRLTFLFAIEIEKKKNSQTNQIDGVCMAWALLWPPLTIYGQIEIYFYYFNGNLCCFPSIHLRA